MKIHHIHGLDAYPELKKKFEMECLRAGRDRICPPCTRARIIARYRSILEERRRRDKRS